MARRDGEPLIQDMFRSAFGHDFVEKPEDAGSESIRKGWPKTAEEYPKGYGVATPPGEKPTAWPRHGLFMSWCRSMPQGLRLHGRGASHLEVERR